MLGWVPWLKDIGVTLLREPFRQRGGFGADLKIKIPIYQGLKMLTKGGFTAVLPFSMGHLSVGVTPSR